MTFRRILCVLVILSIASVGLAACQRTRAGAKCRTTDYAEDGTYVLRCVKGRWQRFVTKEGAYPESACARHVADDMAIVFTGIDDMYGLAPL